MVSQTIAATPPLLPLKMAYRNSKTGLTRGVWQQKLASEAYRAIGGVARNTILDEKDTLLIRKKYLTCSQHVFFTFNNLLEFPPCICYMLEGSQLFHRGPEEEGIHGSTANFHKTSMDARAVFEFSRFFRFFWAVHQDPLSVS